MGAGTRGRWWHTPFGNRPFTVAVWWLVWTPVYFAACTYVSLVLVWFLAQLTGWGITQILTTPPNPPEGT